MISHLALWFARHDHQHLFAYPQSIITSYHQVLSSNHVVSTSPNSTLADNVLITSTFKPKVHDLNQRIKCNYNRTSFNTHINTLHQRVQATSPQSQYHGCPNDNNCIITNPSNKRKMNIIWHLKVVTCFAMTESLGSLSIQRSSISHMLFGIWNLNVQQSKHTSRSSSNAIFVTPCTTTWNTIVSNTWTILNIEKI